jgi:hypothetical protein
MLMTAEPTKNNLHYTDEEAGLPVEMVVFLLGMLKTQVQEAFFCTEFAFLRHIL